LILCFLQAENIEKDIRKKKDAWYGYSSNS